MLGIGEKVKNIMKNKIKYTNKKLNFGKRVNDFLPSIKELKEANDTVKVTIALTKRSKEFFKKEAKKSNTKYQVMIRQLIDEYAKHNSA